MILPLSEGRLKFQADFHFKGRDRGHGNQVELLGAYWRQRIEKLIPERMRSCDLTSLRNHRGRKIPNVEGILFLTDEVIKSPNPQSIFFIMFLLAIKVVIKFSTYFPF